MVGIVNGGKLVLVRELGLVLPFLTKAFNLSLFPHPLFRSALVGSLSVRSPNRISSAGRSSLLGYHRSRRFSCSPLIGLVWGYSGTLETSRK